jgi:hypothetical protein
VGEGDLEGLPGPVIFFKGKLDLGKVREVAEDLGSDGLSSSQQLG